MSIKTPCLIQDRCGAYYFRMIVPTSWRNTVKKTEIRHSLRTKDVAIARQVALLLSSRMASVGKVPLPAFRKLWVLLA